VSAPDARFAAPAEPVSPAPRSALDTPTTAQPTPEPWPTAPPVPPEPLTAAVWSPWGSLGVVGLMVLFNVFGTLPALLLADGLSDSVAQLLLFGGLMAYYLAMLGVVAFGAHRRGVGLAAAVGIRPVPWRHALGVAFAASVGARILVGVYGAAASALGYEPRLEFDPTQLFADDVIGAVLLVAVAVVAAPLVEEIVFRGIVFPAFASRYGMGWGIAVSSALFGVIHLQGFNTVPFIFLGVVFARLFASTRSLWTAILCHALFNGTSLVLIYVLRATGAL